MTQAAGAPWRRSLDRWQLCATTPGRWANPAAVQADPAQWLDVASGTVASMLRGAGLWSLDGPARRFDAEDWWLRARVNTEATQGMASGACLHLEGLAGLADLWVDGRHLLRSENMFVGHVVALSDLDGAGPHDVHLRFSSLDAALATRRARPRWRAPMIENQQLRWFRQTPIGRTPGWSPPVAPVGPWRAVWLECGGGPPLRDVSLKAELDADGHGLVQVRLRSSSAQAPGGIELELHRHGQVHSVALRPEAGEPRCWQGHLRVDAPALWWPHTHGEPALYAARLRVQREAGQGTLDWPLSDVGFRRVTLDTADGGFGLRVNGETVFCRGACWMPLDVVSLEATPRAYRDALAQMREAGMNMVRVSGTTVYESEAFFEACDAAGVLVWQEFMFANMDFPAEDAAFAASVRVEATQQLARWRAHPSLAVVCGNSEVEQQAAMWGAPRTQWTPALFHEVLRACSQEVLPQVPYWPSSAHGGAFPHQAEQGTTSYYGVGAYLRPQDDARRAHLRFATECLAFSNVPESSTIARMPQGHALRVHHPAWKARSPRDLGAGWDFEDVRDHYLQQLYGVDPMRCRYGDHERYLALSRLVSGELMAGAFAEWRRPGSGCGGALVWCLRDLWAGAGWGLLDELGQPKACWWLVRRALQPRVLLLTDEGGNGLTGHLVNEHADAQRVRLRVALHGPAGVPIAHAERALMLAARGAASVALADMFDDFFDLAYSYRFGPPPLTLVHAQWLDAQAGLVSEAFHLPAGRALAPLPSPPLEAAARRSDDGSLHLHLQASDFVQSLHIDLEGWALSDNHFHMAPGSAREVVARPLPGAPRQAAQAWLRPLNAATALALRWAV